MTEPRETIRIAAVGDLHYGKAAPGTYQALFASLAERADVLLLCGDLTDYGMQDEAKALVRDVGTLKIPILAVLGNHDHESGHPSDVSVVLRDAGIRVLDGDSVEVLGVGFAGVKGFVGGFGPRMLAPWGEESIKHFVHEAVDEALKLDSALAKLRTPRRVAFMHYAPIESTVHGEPREIFAFLGSSRLEEPLNRFRVSAVFHGHAHHGSAEGRIASGAPVYNVAQPLLQRLHPDRPPVRIVELPIAEVVPEVERRITDRRGASLPHADTGTPEPVGRERV
jgi:Icc-related predicted phosphoesterase